MFISDGDQRALERKLGQGMKDPVTLLVFVDDSGTSKELVDFANSIAPFSDKIKVDIQQADMGKNQKMKDLRLERWPIMVLQKDGFSRIRYYGFPGGYEFPAIVDAIAELSNSSTPLSPKAKEALSKVRRKANIKVFVLTTCPFCPTVARHAYRAAIDSPMVTAEIIDSSVFLDLAARHTVMGVPKMILNENTDITGAVDELAFFEKLREADHALIDSMFG